MMLQEPDVEKELSVDRVTVWLRGGLGNQLFQYSAGLSASRLLNAKLFLRCDLLPLSEDQLGLVARWPEQLSTFAHEGVLTRKTTQPLGGTSLRSKLLTARGIILSRAGLVARHIGLPNEEDFWSISSLGRPACSGNLSLNGYFLDAKIPLSIGPSLRESLFNVVDPHPHLSYLQQDLRGSRALHIRLGDHMLLDPTLHKRIVSQLEIALQARGETQSVKWALFTDSPNKAQEILSSLGVVNAHIVNTSGLRPIEILALMASCDGLVASSSTFAWWAAYMQNKPENVTFIDTQKFQSWKDLALPGWESIGTDRPVS